MNGAPDGSADEVVVSIRGVTAQLGDIPGQFVVTLQTNHGDIEAVFLPCEGKTGCVIFIGDEGAERVRAWFGDWVKGPVERFELPNLEALNFVLHGALDGGALVSLRLDTQGKTYGFGLLRMEIEVPDDLPVQRLAG